MRSRGSGSGHSSAFDGRALSAWASLGSEKGRGKGSAVGDLKMIFVVEMDLKDGRAGRTARATRGRDRSTDIRETGVEQQTL